MYEYELIDEQQARELIDTCQKDYAAGSTVKAIEVRLRELRKRLEDQEGATTCK